MALDKLPKELLFMTIAYLPAVDLEALALTLNKAVTLTCLPGLQPLFARRRHHKAMLARFKTFRVPISPVHWLGRCRKMFNIPENAELNEYDDEISSPLDLSYLNFKGDLHWLGPLDQRADSKIRRRRFYTSDALQEVLEHAQRASIVLPPAFVKLFQNQHLMDRMPYTNSHYLEIAGGLRKCPAAVDSGAGGYMVRFYAASFGCGYCLLYILPGEEGTHVVLGSAFDSGPGISRAHRSEQSLVGATKEETDRAKKEGWKLANVESDSIWLEGLDFEEWLAHSYFKGWVDFALHNHVDWDDTNVQPLRTYGRRVYVKT